MARSVLIFGCLIWLSATGPDRAWATPVSIRARTQVHLESERRSNGLSLVGYLFDDGGAAVANETVVLELGADIARARTTDAQGRFEVLIGGAALNLLTAQTTGSPGWRVRFDGDRYYGRAVARGEVDLTRATPKMVLKVAPAVVGLDDSEVQVTVGLSGPWGPVAGAEVSVRVGDGAELVGVTGRSGAAVFLIRARLLMEPGRYRVVARFTGDQMYAAAHAEGDLRASLPTRVTLRIGREGTPPDARYRFSGRLSDEAGAIADAPVAIAGHGQGGGGFSLMGITGADGVFLVVMDAAEMSRGSEPLGPRRGASVSVQALYAPAGDRHQASISPSITVEMAPPPAMPLRWYLAALGILLAVAAFAHLWRRRKARVLFRARPIPSPNTPNASDESGGGATSHPPKRVEGAFIRPAGASGGRRDWVAGLVVDAHTDEVVADATLSWQQTTAVDVSAVGASAAVAGRFAVGPLAAGRYRIQIEGRGYLPRDLVVTIPHGGALDGATFSLVAVRRRIRDVYTQAAETLQTTMRWGVDTPLEVYGEMAARGHASAALADLRILVEEAWFTEVPMDASHAAEARRLLRQLDGI